MLQTWKAGEAKLNGYLEDYAYLIGVFSNCTRPPYEPRWFVAVKELADTMIDHFGEPEGASCDTSDDHEDLITRPRDLQDNATLSVNAMAVTALLRLARFTTSAIWNPMTHKPC